MALVLFDLVTDVFAGLADDVAMMQGFHPGFETKRDEQADGNGGDVDEEVAPVEQWMMWRMNFQSSALLDDDASMVTDVRRAFGSSDGLRRKSHLAVANCFASP